MIKIGISSCFSPPDNQRAIFKGKTLLYLAQPLSDWILSKGALAYVIPSIPENSSIRMSDFVQDLDGLVLQGGADVAPQSYGEVPLKPEWSGDYVRDQYEKELFNEFRAQKKPILGVCRGLQLINVVLGGSLYQDINTQVDAAKKHNMVHRNWEIYDQNFHEIEFEKNSYLSQLYPKISHATVMVNSIHHQGIKSLAPGLEIEAKSIPDHVIEAVKLKNEWVVGVQWHPEFHKDFHSATDGALLSAEPLLMDFLKAAKERSQ